MTGKNLIAGAVPEGALGPRSANIAPSESDFAYAAGFFDADGCVTIGINRKAGKSRKIMTFSMRVSASQVDIAPLVWLRDRWSGTVIRVRQRSVRHQQTYTWVCSSRDAEAFLRDVLPWLIVKRERALLALELRTAISQPGRKGHPPSYWKKMQSIFDDMASLNGHRGNRARASDRLFPS